jgi:D-alanyl-D-alanine carboxypeptidase
VASELRDTEEKTPSTGTSPIPPMSDKERVRVFGQFKWAPNPSAGNKEAISIDPLWVAQNIITIPTPQLAALGVSHVRFHRLAVKQFAGLIEAWNTANLLHGHVLTWDGSFYPRLKRGHGASSEPEDLSNHSWGTAFDINARWNPLGVKPVLRGQPGSVRELVPIARQFGFYWGGDFHKPDGMHFEICRLIQI